MSEKINRDDEILGQRLQIYREQAGVTQQAMADACGLSKNYISAVERGVHKCNAKTFITYGHLCNVSLDQLANPSDRFILAELQDILSKMSREQQEKMLMWLKSLEI